MKGKVDEPNGSRKRLSRDERRRTTIDTVSLIEIEDLFRSNDNSSVQKLTSLVIFKKPFILAPEHARSILMVDLNTSVSYRLIYFDQLVKFGIETFRERSGRWSPRVSDKDGFKDGFQQ